MDAAKPVRTVGQEQLAIEAEAILAHYPAVREAVTRALADEAAGREVPTWSADDVLAETEPPTNRDLP